MVDKETEQQIKKLQLFEQNLQGYLAQKQQVQSQLVEINSALQEVNSTKKSYKIVGNIMILKDSSVLNKELLEKKEILELKIKSLEKQENMLKEKSKKIQDDVMKKMKEE